MPRRPPDALVYYLDANLDGPELVKRLRDGGMPCEPHRHHFAPDARDETWIPPIELVQVHSLKGVREMLPVLREQKQARRLSYVGVTTSRDDQYGDLLEIMRREQLDFIQVDYSIADRNAADKILPLAAERGTAVLVNLPLGRGDVLAKVKDRPMPEWAKQIDATSFAQVFLKYVVSHPAVTVAIPGTTKVEHLEDNLGAARGRLPDAAMRRSIEKLFDAL